MEDRSQERCRTVIGDRNFVDFVRVCAIVKHASLANNGGFACFRAGEMRIVG